MVLNGPISCLFDEITFRVAVLGMPVPVIVWKDDSVGSFEDG